MEARRVTPELDRGGTFLSRRLLHQFGHVIPEGGIVRNQGHAQPHQPMGEHPRDALEPREGGREGWERGHLRHRPFNRPVGEVSSHQVVEDGFPLPLGAREQDLGMDLDEFG